MKKIIGLCLVGAVVGLWAFALLGDGVLQNVGGLTTTGGGVVNGLTGTTNNADVAGRIFVATNGTIFLGTNFTGAVVTGGMYGTNTFCVDVPGTPAAFVVRTNGVTFLNGQLAVKNYVGTTVGFYMGATDPAGGLDIGFSRVSANRVKVDNFSGSTLGELNGIIIDQVATKTTNYTATAFDSVILVNGTTLTMTLPTAVGNGGRQYTIKEIANSTATIATTSSQNIDASTTYSLSAQYKYVKVVSDGAQWWVIANN